VGDNKDAEVQQNQSLQEPPAEKTDGDISDIFGLLDGINPESDWRKEREDAWSVSTKPGIERIFGLLNGVTDDFDWRKDRKESWGD